MLEMIERLRNQKSIQIDKCKTNNTLENLEWVTDKENKDHSAGLRLQSYGLSHQKPKT